MDRTVLSTTRLRLRPVAPVDRSFYVALYRDPRVTLHLERTPAEADLPRVFDAVLAHAVRDDPGHGFWIVESREPTAASIGWITLRRHAGGAEIGIMLAPAWQRCGIASEAFAALLPHAFASMGLAFVDAERDANGHADVIDRLLKPLGFRVEPDPPVGRRRWRLDAGAGRVGSRSPPG